MKHLFVIGGPMGVGKTAACRQLQQLLSRSVFLDGDWCWDMRPFVVSDETRAMVMDNIAHLLGNFLRCSAFDHVIFCWVIHQQAILDELLARLPLEGVAVVCVSLICSEAALTERLCRDIGAGLRTPDVLARSLAYLPLYGALDTHRLDTTHLTALQTAQAILRIADEA
ncbi:MAG: AAA family ATPase [Candidatus Ventricola sp.]